VNAALEVIDRVSIDALTIRAIASLVGAPPMSLYTHFANKEELLDLMYAEMSRRIYTDPGHDTWQAELLGLALQLRQTLLAHPRWAPLLSRPAQPLAVPVRERVLRLMTDQGMAPGPALRAFSSTMVVAIGLSLVELSFRDAEGVSSLTKRFDRAKTWFEKESNVGHDSMTREAFAALRRFDLGELFEYSISQLVKGVELEQNTPAKSS
jgi:AcrR family transcriptional regulator